MVELETTVRPFFPCDLHDLTDLVGESQAQDVLESVQGREEFQWAFIARSNEGIVGYLLYTFDPQSGSHCVEDIFVADERRREGFGQLLIQMLLITESGTSEAFVPDDNLPAHKFFSSQGYKAFVSSKDPSKYRFVIERTEAKHGRGE